MVKELHRSFSTTVGEFDFLTFLLLLCLLLEFLFFIFFWLFFHSLKIVIQVYFITHVFFKCLLHTSRVREAGRDRVCCIYSLQNLQSRVYILEINVFQSRMKMSKSLQSSVGLRRRRDHAYRSSQDVIQRRGDIFNWAVCDGQCFSK